MDDDVVRRRWEREQLLLGLARQTPDDEFAAGGLAALAAPPAVRIVVRPRDPDTQALPAADPATVIPQRITLPDGSQVPHHGTVRGTSRGYVAYVNSGDGSMWPSFIAVQWHGGVDLFLGAEGGRDWEYSGGDRRRVIFMQTSVTWAWGAFDLQRQMVERYSVVGPFRVILGVARTAGAYLSRLGAGWLEPGSPYGVPPTAIEPRVLLLEDLPQWPDGPGIEALAFRFAARLDLAFGGNGERHLDREGPRTGRYNPR